MKNNKWMLRIIQIEFSSKSSGKDSMGHKHNNNINSEKKHKLKRIND